LHRLAIELCRLTIELCRLTIELHRLTIELHRLAIELCRLAIELCRLAIELCRLTIELCRPINSYDTTRSDASVDKLQQAYQAMLAQQQTETEKLTLYRAAADAARLAEWEFHNTVLAM